MAQRRATSIRIPAQKIEPDEGHPDSDEEFKQQYAEYLGQEDPFQTDEREHSITTEDGQQMLAKLIAIDGAESEPIVPVLKGTGRGSGPNVQSASGTGDIQLNETTEAEAIARITNELVAMDDLHSERQKRKARYAQMQPTSQTVVCETPKKSSLKPVKKDAIVSLTVLDPEKEQRSKPAPIQNTPRIQGKVAHTNVFKATTMFKKLVILSPEIQMELYRAGLDAVKVELASPTLGINDAETTSRPCILSALRDIMTDSDDVLVKMECTQLIEAGAWKDLLLLLQQSVKFFDGIPRGSRYQTHADLLKISQTDLLQWQEIQADRIGHMKIKEYQSDLYGIMLKRKFEPYLKGVSLEVIENSVRNAHTVTQFIVDFMGHAEMVPILIPLDGKHHAFNPLAVNQVGPQIVKQNQTGEGMDDMQKHAIRFPSSPDQRSHIRFRDEMVKRLDRAASALNKVHNKFPWFWRYFYGLVEVSEALAIKYAVTRYVPQTAANQIPIVRDFSGWQMNDEVVKEPTRRAHALLMVEASALGMAMVARRDAVSILSQYNIPGPTNYVTYNKEVTDYLRKLERLKMETDPDTRNKILNAEKDHKNAVFALDNLTEKMDEEDEKKDKQ